LSLLTSAAADGFNGAVPGSLSSTPKGAELAPPSVYQPPLRARSRDSFVLSPLRLYRREPEPPRTGLRPWDREDGGSTGGRRGGGTGCGKTLRAVGRGFIPSIIHAKSPGPLGPEVCFSVFSLVYRPFSAACSTPAKTPQKNFENRIRGEAAFAFLRTLPIARKNLPPSWLRNVHPYRSRHVAFAPRLSAGCAGHTRRNRQAHREDPHRP
jgi:hypothetical protein